MVYSQKEYTVLYKEILENSYTKEERFWQRAGESYSLKHNKGRGDNWTGTGQEMQTWQFLV